METTDGALATGAELIATERARQIAEEGYTPEHDDQWWRGELAWAAVCYAAPDRVLRAVADADPWPWDAEWDKRRKVTVNGESVAKAHIGYSTIEERIRLLVKAGALIAAEIDRWQREMPRTDAVPDAGGMA